MNIKIPVSWLREYLKTDLAAKTIANYLSLSGPSVERIEKKGEDYIFDIEVTTNRIDAFSVFGIAREAYAILSAEGQKTDLMPPKGLSQNLQPETSYQLPLDVIIKNKAFCPRFSAIILDNVEIKPSPAFIKNRLEDSGIRAIDNIVDIANYLMLELGQPMHTFDFDKIKNHKMILRESREGEKITTLDGITRKLPKGAIVIEDHERLIDLCGIMGGQNSEISRRTKRVILFVQAYDPLKIRKTTQALAFRTEAAERFEKGVDVEGIIPALSRAVYLAKKTAGAKIASELVNIRNAQTEKKSVNLNLQKLADYLGIEISREKATKILSLLGFEVKSTAQTIYAIPPGWRIADCQNDVDLIEEIARIYGYWRLPAKLPSGQIPTGTESELAKVIELKKALKYLGLTEIISYSIISEDFLKLTGTNKKEAVELTSPLTSQWQFMRPTILVSLTEIIAKNQNLAKDIKIFEVAKTYVFPEEKSQLPVQDLYLAIALQNANFEKIKGLVENVFEILKRNIKFQKLTSESPLYDKNQSAQIRVEETIVGTLGIQSSQITDYFEIEQPLTVAEINLTTCYLLPATSYKYQPIPKYPPVIEDISAVFDEKIAITDIIREVTQAGSPIVKKVEIIDVFRDEKIGENKKSVTLRFTYQKSTGTPTNEEVQTSRAKIIDILSKSFAAIIRR